MIFIEARPYRLLKLLWNRNTGLAEWVQMIARVFVMPA